MQDAPAYAADGQAPWVIASGVIYPEDITDDSPYLFSELPGRFTGSYSGYNQDPLYVLGASLLSLSTSDTSLFDLPNNHGQGIPSVGLSGVRCAWSITT